MTYKIFFLLILNFQVLSKDLIYNKQADSDWLPLTYIINGTFDVAQNQNWFNQSDFSSKSTEVWRRVKDPIHNIKKDGGWSEFIQEEFLGDRVLPNILLHTLGGAYDGRWLEEYYRDKGIKYPLLMATLNSYLARWGNEVLEVSEEQITSHDHIADLYFFDTLGIFLSTNDRFMNYLVQDLAMRAWHSLPYYAPETGDFINSGLNYIFRPQMFSLSDSITPFYYFGMQNIFGLSLKDQDKTYSLGTGFFLTNPLERKMRIVTSFFYEKDDQLAFSAFINGSEGFRWRTNFYPTLSNITKSYNIGFLLGQRRSNDLTAGLTIRMPFGISTK